MAQSPFAPSPFDPRGQPGVNPPPARPPAPPGGDTWGDWDEATRAFYTNQDPQSFWRQFVAHFGDPNSARGRFSQSQFGRAWADYTRATEANPGLLLPDFLTPDYWAKLQGDFDSLSWDQRGESAPSQGVGRIVWAILPAVLPLVGLVEMACRAITRLA